MHLAVFEGAALEHEQNQCLTVGDVTDFLCCFLEKKFKVRLLPVTSRFFLVPSPPLPEMCNAVSCFMLIRPPGS